MIYETIIVNSITPVRLDRYIRRLFPLITQGEIELNLRRNKIKINDHKAKASDRLINNDKITFYSNSFEDYKITHNKIYPPKVIKLAEIPESLDQFHCT